MKSNGIQSPIANGYDADHSHKHNHRLKGSLTLSNAEMLELIEDEQKFADQIIHLNKLGKECILGEDYQNAIAYLQEAQKILQYAASCGKTIDRFLIIATLHNEATVYQKVLQLHKSYDYMEAILFNLKKYFQQNSNINITQQILDKDSQCYKIKSSYIHRKISTLVYSLQFAAISSQVEKHEVAIESAKKALFLLNSVIQQFIVCNKHLRNAEIKEQELKNLCKYCNGIDKSTINNLCKSVRHIVTKARVHSVEDKPHQLKFKKFSIGEVMQMQPTTFRESNQCIGVENLVSSYWVIRIALYTSIAYYTIATELRLTAKKDCHEFEHTNKYQKSKIFHLFAIKIALEFAPFFSDYHEHIVKSFKNNHHIDLNAELPDQAHDQKIKQNLLDSQSFVLRKQLIFSHQISNITKVESQTKNMRPRRISSDTSNNLDKPKVHPFNLNLKKKKAKSKSKEKEVTQSRQTLHKQKLDVRKSMNLRHDKKLNSIPIKSSRTKLGKPKRQSERHKRSEQKTKEHIKKSENLAKKQKNKKKILEQYMSFPDQGKKSINNKRSPKKIHTQYQKSKSKSKNKSKSKSRHNFASPKGISQSQTNHNHNHYQNSFNFNYNIGVRSPKNK